MSAGLSSARIEMISAYRYLTVLYSGRTELTLLLITVNVWSARLFFYWLQWTFDISSLLITVNVIGLSCSCLPIHSGSQTVVACYLISFRCFYEPDRISPLLTTDYSERLLSSASCPASWSTSLLITVNVIAAGICNDITDYSERLAHSASGISQALSRGLSECGLSSAPPR